jgi:hypothetical protein
MLSTPGTFGTKQDPAWVYLMLKASHEGPASSLGVRLSLSVHRFCGNPRTQNQLRFGKCHRGPFFPPALSPRRAIFSRAEKAVLAPAGECPRRILLSALVSDYAVC